MSDEVILIVICFVFGFALLALKDLFFGYKNNSNLQQKPEKLKGKE